MPPPTQTLAAGYEHKHKQILYTLALGIISKKKYNKGQTVFNSKSLHLFYSKLFETFELSRFVIHHSKAHDHLQVAVVSTEDHLFHLHSSQCHAY